MISNRLLFACIRMSYGKLHELLLLFYYRIISIRVIHVLPIYRVSFFFIKYIIEMKFQIKISIKNTFFTISCFNCFISISFGTVCNKINADSFTFKF
jgi:hypothetical protein